MKKHLIAPSDQVNPYLAQATRPNRTRRTGLALVAMASLLVAAACSDTEPKNYSSYDSAQHDIDTLAKKYDNDSVAEDTSDKGTRAIEEALAGTIPLFKDNTLKAAEKIVPVDGNSYSFGTFTDANGVKKSISVNVGELDDGLPYKSIDIALDGKSEMDEGGASIIITKENGGTEVSFSAQPDTLVTDEITVASDGKISAATVLYFGKDDKNNGANVVEFDGKFGAFSDAGPDLAFVAERMKMVDSFMIEATTAYNQLVTDGGLQ